MPNWVKNNVEFGSEEVIKKCMDDRNVDIDFDKIIPMPKILEDDSKEEFNKMTLEERLVFLKENDGCDDWYSWRLKFWGCKWGASETYIVDKTHVTFQTPWSMPDEIFKAISKKFNTTVVVEYADEGISENSGRVVYKNGEELSYEQGDGKFYDRVWGSDTPLWGI